MPWKYNGSVVATNKGFRKTDGYMTPKNWNAVWDDTEKKNQGFEHWKPIVRVRIDLRQSG